ncbi:hypothetical protein A7K94_0217960, partial [Modestobacter sp. VKM Ac-2676]
MVRGDPDRLTDDGQPGSPVPGCPGVLQGELRVLLEQPTGGHEVLPDDVGVARVQTAERSSDGGVQLADVRPLRQLR